MFSLGRFLIDLMVLIIIYMFGGKFIVIINIFFELYKVYIFEYKEFFLYIIISYFFLNFDIILDVCILKV